MFWISLWYLLHVYIQKELYLPAPIDVIIRITDLIVKQSFWISIGSTMFRVLVGILLSLTVGTAFGIIASFNRVFYDLLFPFVSAIKSTPVMSFIILALLWFSSSNVPIFICFLMCFPIVYSNVIEGIRNTDRTLVEMAKVYGVTKKKILSKIFLPSIRPYILAAVSTTLGLGWKVSVAAEVLSHPRFGIGSNIFNAKVYLDSVELFAWTFVVIILSVCLESLFQKVMKVKYLRGNDNIV